MRLTVIPFEQPAGTFMLAVMKASDIISVAVASPRRFDSKTMDTFGGVQRVLSHQRVDEIATYANTVDATFPTPILLALNDGSYTACGNNEIELLESCKADIVDGQHRLQGLAQSGRAADFHIPVVFIVAATEEQKALIFATINGKQTKVPASLIYELFGVTETRSPQKTAHEIARALNSMVESPWHKRLKMLGTKTELGTETLSQGTLIKHLLPLISSNPVSDMDSIRSKKPLERRPECVFNSYFVDNKDATILRILLNYFTAAKRTWPTEWDNPANSILTKSVGCTGLMLALPDVAKKGLLFKDLSFNYFLGVFSRTKELLAAKGLALDSANFAASSAGAGRLRDLLREALG